MTAEDQSLKPIQKLGNLVASARKQMTPMQYQAIRKEFPNPVCMAFFTKLADRIQANNSSKLTLDELESFGIQELDLSDNQLESIDVSGLMQLQLLNLSEN